MALEPGELISPSVRLVRPLGQGSMGDVWVAEHLALRADVAVKTMTPALADDAAALARFAREASTAARINSPHVVRIFDFSTSGSGAPFIVMELLEGEDLGKRLDRDVRLDLADTATIVTQTGRALARAHAAGVIHRDVKPENLFLLDVEGELFVKVLDFGVAKADDFAALAMTATGVTVGTPYYMSPEQLLSAKHATPRCDLWSLAVVAYHCLTGSVPFEGETFGALCVAIDKGDFAPPSALCPYAPVALDSWFRKALQRSPDERFPSARAFVDAFALACEQPAIALPVPPPIPHERRPVVPLMPWALATLCIAATSGATAGMIARRTAPRSTMQIAAIAAASQPVPPATIAALPQLPLLAPERQEVAPHPEAPAPRPPSTHAFGNGPPRARSRFNAASSSPPPPLPPPRSQHGAGALGPGTPFPSGARGNDGVPVP